MGTIVVGVDGSEESQAALRWAAEEAGLRNADLKVVYAYDYQPPWRQHRYGDDIMSSGTDSERVRERLEHDAAEAREHAEALLNDIAADAGDAGVKFETLAIEHSNPAEVLVDVSVGADLLVVGSRGRGGFRGLVLGSVSQQCVQHATCPVTVIRGGG
jgi:nucleotide-binding universal stress UspA family protein